MPFLFEKLRVYREAVELAESIISLTKTFPRGFYFLADQLNRAATSVPANIAEGNGRFTKADRKNFFIIARGSLLECIPLLDIAHRNQLVDDVLYQSFRNKIEAVSKMVSGLIKGAGKRAV